MSEASAITDLTTKLQSADPIAVAEALRLLERLASLFAQKFDLDAMLTAKQAAEWLQCSVVTLNKLADKNQIPSIPFGNERRYHPRTILSAGHERYFRAHPNK